MDDVSKNRIPGEWEEHKVVRLAWPYDETTFGTLNEKDEILNPLRLGKVENIYLQIFQALEGSEKINLFVRNGSSDLRISKEINLIEVDYADVWTRDYMPTFVKDENNKVKAVKWIYNAYGEKFEGLIKDNEVWGKLVGSIETIETELILEGGAIESNGEGVILTTEECLLKRNPNLSKTEIEKLLGKYVGAKKVLWLSAGLINDHTDGHIDEIARFVSSNKILCAYEDNEQDENYEILKKNYEDLCSFTDANGKPFEIIKLPMPHMIYNNGEKTPASYTNFYIGNKVVLVSVFGDPNDDKAVEIIQGCFPDRKVAPINCRELIYGGGAIHCITAQQPLE